ncbi:MAG: electron transfer flavoprotein subunit alpha/FixB family protein [Deltaproteobacteria bacterium]|nr:electron transfer flavoprotein subunit alpha/FixB family protein [Deltaproteobacteria bacterium]
MSLEQSLQGSGPVVAVAEVREGRLAPLTRELAGLAGRLAALWGVEARLVVLDAAPGEPAATAARQTGLAVTALAAPELPELTGEAVARLLAGFLPAWQPRAIVGGHTTLGLDWAPSLAARLGAACLTGVEGLAEAADGPRFFRPGRHDKLVEEYRIEERTLVLTVQPGAFPAPPEEPLQPGPVTEITLPRPALRVRVREARPGVAADAALARAEVVVAAGLGVGKPENLELVRRVASLFSQAAVAGSRPVCDLGWLGYESQVGLTGATVAPRLYLACGISGARQHTVGMQGAGFIVAISQDPRAAIFQLADVCVVEDLLVFLPMLLELAGAGRGGEGE